MDNINLYMFIGCPECKSKSIMSTNDGYRTQICCTCGLKIYDNGIFYKEKKPQIQEIKKSIYDNIDEKYKC
jgi:hypothetical protein